MTIANLLVIAALAGAVVLVGQAPARLFAVIALVAAAIEALFLFGILSIAVKGISVPLLLALALVVAGIACWLRVGTRTAVTAATVVSFVGVIQLLHFVL